MWSVHVHVNTGKSSSLHFGGNVHFQPRRFAILKWFEDACVRMLVYSTGIVRNELICGYANVVHTSSSFRPHTHTMTHTHTLSTFSYHPDEDREPADGAKSGHSHFG